MTADDYIRFDDCAVPDVRKTRIVNVINRRTDVLLGQIRWYGPWRQYCLFVCPNTIFNVTCLARINEEITRMKREQATR